MSAKIAMLAVVASMAVSSVAATQPPSVFARAQQGSFAFGEENVAEGETEADAFGPNDQAYADAEGFAGFLYVSNFAEADTKAETLATNADAESIAISTAASDGVVKAEAVTEAVSTTSGAGIGDAYARSSAGALPPYYTGISNYFAGADTLAEAFGADDAAATADSIAVAEEDAEALSEADSIAVFGDATSNAISTANGIAGEALDDLSFADSDAFSNARNGGSADSSAFSAARNADESRATATAYTRTDAGTFVRAGRATGSARSTSQGK